MTCGTGTKISSVGEGKGEKEQRRKRGIHNKCYCSSYSNAKYGHLIVVAYSVFKRIISLFKLAFFVLEYILIGIIFWCFYLLLKKCSEIRFFCIPPCLLQKIDL